MITPNGFKGYDDLLGDLAAQEKAAQKRHLEPASPTEFLKWITQTLREKRKIYSNLMTEHRKLDDASGSVEIGLKRLEGLVRFGDRMSLDYLKDMHRAQHHSHRGVGVVLGRCNRILKETTVQYQLIGETLKGALADKHKKIAMQKELGLRLRDVDDQFARCRRAVESQKVRNRQLATGIQKLMSKASIKMPPKLKEMVIKEDRVKKIAQNLTLNLAKGVDNVNPQPTVEIKGVSGWELGDEPADVPASAPERQTIKRAETPAAPSVEEGVDVKFAIGATLVGAIAGSLLYHMVVKEYLGA
jgi:hypothetical protein